MAENPKLIDKWFIALPRHARRAMPAVIAAADASNTPLYLVGGPLRDLLLDQPPLDVDLVVEADAIEFARLAGRYLDARVKTHHAFGTATISGPEYVIDIATARTETYAHPGALPKVRPAPIADDLLRRDFTVNAIALRLNGTDRGEVLDPTGGRSDLDARLIRVLHDRSFQDDPTRILRAARYAARLAFRIEPRTLRWLKRDTHNIKTISSARLHHEFARIFDDPRPEAALRQLERHGVLAAIHPALRFERTETAVFQRLRALNPHGARAAYWSALPSRRSFADVASLATRLALTRPQRAAVEAIPRLRNLESRLRAPRSARPEVLVGRAAATAPRLSRSSVADLLAPFPIPALWVFAAATTGPTARRVLDYLTAARHSRPVLRGDDLIALGVPQGPAVGEMLRRLRAAKLDGEVKTKRDEIRLVEQSLGRGGFLEESPPETNPPPSTPRARQSAPSRSS